VQQAGAQDRLVQQDRGQGYEARWQLSLING